MDYADEILEFIANHEGSYFIEDIAEDIGINPYKCKIIVRFFERHGFVEIEDSKISISPHIKRLLIETAQKPDVLALQTSSFKRG
jgi:DNA-binding IclR family transcriptional regulator